MLKTDAKKIHDPMEANNSFQTDPTSSKNIKTLPIASKSDTCETVPGYLWKNSATALGWIANA
jgi:hypothetical protein